MKKYRIILTEHYIVEAESEDEAVETYQDGTSEMLIHDDIEVVLESEFQAK